MIRSDRPVPPGYAAAETGAVLIERPWRKVCTVSGRQPEKTLTGILSGAMPPPHRIEAARVEVRHGRMTDSAILTPKGRIVSEMRVGRAGEGDSAPLLLDLPEAGFAGAMAHFSRFLPPRLARVEPNPGLGILSVVGPTAASLLSDATGVEADDLARSVEGEEWIVGGAPGGAESLRIVRSGEVRPSAFDLLASADARRTLARMLAERGAVPSDEHLWKVFRIEKGRPEFGIEIDEDTLPFEAEMDRRSIDHTKGCYTGQEVIVRIRDRGHVNRRLRGLLLGDPPVVERDEPDGTLEGELDGLRGKKLFDAEGKEVGEVRSAVHSPRLGQGIALGFVRREVAPPAEVRVGSAIGRLARVRALNDDGWTLVAGDPSFYP